MTSASVMVEPIISQLGKKRLLRTHHLQFLLNKRTSVLNLFFAEDSLDDMPFTDPIEDRLNQRLLHGQITQCQVSNLLQYLSMQYQVIHS